MGYTELMNMPIRAFWVFSRNVERIEAYSQNAALKTTVLGQVGGEAAQEHSNELILTMGELGGAEIFDRTDEKEQTAAFNELREAI